MAPCVCASQSLNEQAEDSVEIIGYSSGSHNFFTTNALLVSALIVAGEKQA
jgi:hypothetical protein